MSITSSKQKSPGKLGLATWLCGFSGAMLAIVLDLLGLFANLREKCLVWFIDAELLSGEPEQIRELFEYGLVIVVCLFVALFLLDSVGAWKKAFICICLLVLLVGAVASCAAWNLFLSPLMIGSAILAVIVCSFFYSSQHDMGVVAKVTPLKTIEKKAVGKKIEVKTEPEKTEEKKTKQQPRKLKEEPKPNKSDNAESVPLPKVGRAQMENTMLVRVKEVPGEKD